MYLTASLFCHSQASFGVEAVTRVMTNLRAVPVIPRPQMIPHKRAVIMALRSEFVQEYQYFSYSLTRYLQDDSSESSEDERRFIRSIKVMN